MREIPQEATVNRTDLVRAISNKDDLDEQIVGRVLDSFLEVVKMSLSIGEEVSLRGFGRFETKTMTSTVRRVPKTRTIVQVPARSSVRFIPSGVLRQHLNDRANGR
jgi:DNA-binding protein HU-beta